MRSFTRRVLPRAAAVFTTLVFLAALGANTALAGAPWGG
jgi:hypothetical protein